MSQSQEYVVRVPRETKKRFHVMRFSAALQVNVTNWKSGRLERENNIKEFKTASDDIPKFGAGSEFGRDLKEEARRKKFGIATKKYNPDHQPWILQINGRNGKKFKGIREGGVSENTSYYVFFQAHDGAFEAFPVSEWYNFVPIPKFKALTAEEAEEKFVQRDKILNFFSVMASKKKQDGESSEAPEEKSVKKKKRDFKVSDMDDWAYDSDMSGRSDESGDEKKPDTKSKGKKGKKAKPKNKKKKKGSDDDNESALEESDEGDFDQREVDYMSDSSSEEDEKVDKSLLKGVEDEDALRQLVISEDEDEEENEENKKADPNADKAAGDDPKKNPESENKTKIKQEKDDSKSSSSSSSEDSDDSDFDDAKFKSAMFMQNKVNAKNRNGTESSNSSKPNTPPLESIDDKEALKDTKPSTKRKLGSDGSSSSKKQKTLDMSSSSDGITEEAVKRYLMRKPMTTTELLQKFKSKKIPMSGTDFMTTFTQILKKLNPEKQTINGKLYLSIKP